MKCARGYRLKSSEHLVRRMKNTNQIAQVGLIGGGVIGAGWAARLLLNGVDVTLYDPAKRVQKRLNEVVENALRAYRNMTLAPVACSGKLRFAQSLPEAVANADFVQESGPERLEVKQALLNEICAHAAAEVVVASSSSGLLPSDLQSGVRFPQRVVVGHPFNPVYLMPLVEVVGGRQSSAAAKQAAVDFYRRLGMHPLLVRKEIDAFLADRMMEAVWREALHLVNDGIATVDEIDQAICYGPGLRWSFMGIFMGYRIAGGEGGFGHFMKQFGPSLKWPWARFDGPELTAELLHRLSQQSDAQAAGRRIADLEKLRDDCLVSVLQALRAHDTAAGKTLQRYEEKLYENAHKPVMAEVGELAAADSAAALAQPLALHGDTVKPHWVDYNHHMSESCYLQAFGDASDALFRYLGIHGEYHARGFSYYTVETHLNFLREIGVNQPFHITTQLLGGDPKRLHLFHTMYAGAAPTATTADGEPATTDSAVLATAEQMLLHVNTTESRACDVEPPILTRLNRILTAHRDLPRPPQAGRSIQTSQTNPASQ